MYNFFGYSSAPTIRNFARAAESFSVPKVYFPQFASTGKPFSEAIILASTYPQYDKRFAGNKYLSKD